MQNRSGFGVSSGSSGIDGILVIFNVNTRFRAFLFVEDEGSDVSVHSYRGG